MPEQLTLEMIQGSERLKELGAMPGDEFEGKKLIRKFSSKEDRIDLGKKITEEDIKTKFEIKGETTFKKVGQYYFLNYDFSI